MPLPATYADAVHEEMVGRTIKEIQEFRDDIIAQDAEWIVDWLRDRVRTGLTARENMIECARGGCLLSHQALMLEHDEMIDEGKWPPASLIVYARERHRHPRRGKGGNWWANVRRDIIITRLALFVRDYYGIALEPNSASRDKNPKNPYAAVIVAEALTRSKILGRAIAEKTVAAVLRRRPPMPDAWFALIASKQVRPPDPQCRRAV